MIDQQLKDRLRLLKIDLLSFLNTLAVTDSIALDLKEISGSTSTSETNLIRVISTLRRMKVNGESLIMPAGRDNKGRLRWKINELIVKKVELAKFLEEEILGKENLIIRKK